MSVRILIHSLLIFNAHSISLSQPTHAGFKWFMVTVQALLFAAWFKHNCLRKLLFVALNGFSIMVAHNRSLSPISFSLAPISTKTSEFLRIQLLRLYTRGGGSHTWAGLSDHHQTRVLAELAGPRLSLPSSVQGKLQGELEGGRNWLKHKIQHSESSGSD